jgi:hypothetical protein
LRTRRVSIICVCVRLCFSLHGGVRPHVMCCVRVFRLKINVLALFLPPREREATVRSAFDDKGTPYIIIFNFLSHAQVERRFVFCACSSLALTVYGAARERNVSKAPETILSRGLLVQFVSPTYLRRRVRRLKCFTF